MPERWIEQLQEIAQILNVEIAHKEGQFVLKAWAPGTWATPAWVVSRGKSTSFEAAVDQIYTGWRAWDGEKEA